MTSHELRSFHWILIRKRAELEHLHNREGVAIERSADAVDQVRDAIDLEVTVRNLDQESMVLRDVRSALERMKGGLFGVCVNCGGEIAPHRLAAVPWTPLCIHCQQEAERHLANNERNGMRPGPRETQEGAFHV